MRQHYWILIAALGIFQLGLATRVSSNEPEAPLDVCLIVNSTQEIEDAYVYRLLDLALSNQSRPYTLKAEAVQASQRRRVDIVRSSPNNYVINLGSSQDNEHILRPIYVPVFLGLDLSQRIMLTRTELEGDLETIKGLEDLERFTFGQGSGWVDVKILQDAGLKVITSPTKESLMRMLDAGRIDLFPRGLFEVVGEYEKNKDEFPDITIDKHLVLTYPIASFFFVNKENTELHDAIRTGLEKAYASGQMQDLLMNDPMHGMALKRIRVGKRTKIAIPIPNATKATRKALEQFHPIPGKPLGAPAR